MEVLEEAPSAPRNVTVLRVTDTAIKLFWEAPAHSRGLLEGYRLYYSREQSAHNYTDVRMVRSGAVDSVEYVLSELVPNTQYRIWIKAKNSRNEGEQSSTLIATTDVQAPSSPRLVNITCHGPSSLFVAWDKPRVIYGDVDYYTVFYRSESQWEFDELALHPEIGLEIANATEKITPPRQTVVANLTPDALYEVKVRGVTRSKIEQSKVYPGAFSEAKKIYLGSSGCINQGSYTAGAGKIYSHYPLPNGSDIASVFRIGQGNVGPEVVAAFACAGFALFLVLLALVLWRFMFGGHYYYLDDDCDQKSHSRAEVLNMDDVYDSYENPCISISQWSHHVAMMHADGDIGFSKEYESLQQSTGGQIPAPISNLNDAIEIYSATLKGGGGGGDREFSDTDQATTVIEENGKVLNDVGEGGENGNGVVADGEGGKRKSIVAEKVTPEQVKVDLYMAEQSHLEDNKPKNRYLNIVAYDHTRVPLRVSAGQKKTHDYINANFIDGYRTPRAYIGTQGPLPSTFADFWHMCWEQRVHIIVMITNLIERGRRKCDQYWPNEGVETYGGINVRLVNELVLANYTVRTLALSVKHKISKRQAYERMVYQYHYTSWPDHGVPEHPLPVLSFIRKSSNAQPAGAGPIVVHCSAGVGRTGTYIVVDAMLQQIKHRADLNVFSFLRHIRQQRNFLVQTEEQYIFIHDCLLEAIQSGDTDIPLKLLPQYIQSVTTPNILLAATSPCGQNANHTGGPMKVNSATSPTRPDVVSSTTITILPSTGHETVKHIYGTPISMEYQFKLVSQFVPKEFQISASLKTCNRGKIRNPCLVPIDAYRAHILAKPGADGSDYINATYLHGHHRLREFIVTQHPLLSTINDFWQLVWDHNCTTIVVLSNCSDISVSRRGDIPRFWPVDQDDVYEYDGYRVRLASAPQTPTLPSIDTLASLPKSKRNSRASNSTAEPSAIDEDQEQLTARNNRRNRTPSEDGAPTVGDDGILGDNGVYNVVVQSTQDDYELSVRVHYVPGWPQTNTPLSNVVRVVQDVHKRAAPVITVDMDGGCAAATFCCLSTLLHQVAGEQRVDVYQTAKLYHARRPGVWTSMDNYAFLYQVMESLVTSNDGNGHALV